MPVDSALTSPAIKFSPATQPATSWHFLRIHGGCVAGRGGSADQVGEHGHLAHRDFPDHGGWSFPGAVESARSCSWHHSVRADVARAPHLILWALLAGCLWAVANTLTIFAIRDVGLSIAFPLWNSNSLLGILWGFLFFNELRQAGWRRWAGVLGGARLCALARQFSRSLLVAIFLDAFAEWRLGRTRCRSALGHHVHPYRKAYLTGMNPLSFVTFFTFGELGMMAALALTYNGLAPLWHELILRAR